MTPCETPFFQWLDKLNRPVTRWGFSIVAVAYGVRAVFGFDFDPMAFGALVAPAGFTYWRRGDEKLKGIGMSDYLASSFTEDRSRAELERDNIALRKAAQGLIDDVRSRYPGEELRCPHMIALDEALKAGAQ